MNIREYTRMVEMFFHPKTCCLGYEQNSIDEKFVQGGKCNCCSHILRYFLGSRDGSGIGRDGKGGVVVVGYFLRVA